MLQSLSDHSPLYLRVKEYVLARIETGVWGASERIPSENELIRELGVSRMTVNRALRDLAEDGYLVRIVGVGSFVAASKIRVHPLRIRNIADEIRERGHAHGALVLTQKAERATPRLAEVVEMRRNARVFHTVIVHEENGEPLQWEDRYVRPASAPRYLEQDFTRITPSEYLTEVAPLQEVEHTVEAEMAPSRIAAALNLQPGEPCLVITRRTWAKGRIASFAKLYHPGSTYQLHGRFQPGADK